MNHQAFFKTNLTALIAAFGAFACSGGADISAPADGPDGDTMVDPDYRVPTSMRNDYADVGIAAVDLKHGDGKIGSASGGDDYAAAGQAALAMTSSITGYVDDAHDARLANAEVCAWADDESVCTFTDENGRYELSDLPSDSTLIMSFDSDGYATGADVVDTDRVQLYRNAHLVPNDALSTGAEEGTGGLLVHVITHTEFGTEVRSIELDPTVVSGGDDIEGLPTASDELGNALFAGIESGSFELSASELAMDGCVFHSESQVGDTATIDIFDGSVTSVTVLCD